MAVRTKGRRKIIVENTLYLWYISLDKDSPYYMCNIVSEDKSVIVSCPLKTKMPYVISKGKIFQNLKEYKAFLVRLVLFFLLLHIALNLKEH